MSTQYKTLLESWELYLEQLSRAEKEKRRKKRINPAYTPGDEIIPVELQRLSKASFQITMTATPTTVSSQTVKMMGLTLKMASKVNARELNGVVVKGNVVA